MKREKPASKEFMDGFEYARERHYVTGWRLKEWLKAHGPEGADAIIVEHLEGMAALLKAWMDSVRRRPPIFHADYAGWLLNLCKVMDELRWYTVNFGRVNSDAFFKVHRLLAKRACEDGLGRNHPILASGMVGSGQVAFSSGGLKLTPEQWAACMSGEHISLDYGSSWREYFHPTPAATPSPVPGGLLDAAISAAMREVDDLMRLIEDRIKSLGKRRKFSVDLSPLERTYETELPDLGDKA